MLKNVSNLRSLTLDLCSFWNSQCCIQTVNKYSLYGLLLSTKEKHLTKSFSSDWPIIAKASGLPSSE